MWNLPWQHAGFCLVAVHRLSYPVACGILVPGPGIKPTSILDPLDHEGRPHGLLWTSNLAHLYSQILTYTF